MPEYIVKFDSCAEAEAYVREHRVWSEFQIHRYATLPRSERTWQGLSGILWRAIDNPGNLVTWERHDNSEWAVYNPDTGIATCAGIRCTNWGDHHLYSTCQTCGMEG